MPKNIQIEFCSGWGYALAAGKLKNLLHQEFPSTSINFKPAKGKTGKIEVSWIKDNKKDIVW